MTAGLLSLTLRRLIQIKILNLDVETSPAKAYIWDLKTRYVHHSQLIEPKRLLCFAAKWVGEPEVFFHSQWTDDELGMATVLKVLLNDADAVLHYNGQRFDEPVINTAILEAELTPPSPYKRIDLYRVVRTRFSFMSNSLGYVTRQLGTSGKLSHEGFNLWVRVLAGDVEARAKMEEYNRADVHANEALYRRLLPWIDQHPNGNVFDDVEACPACGSLNLVKRGFAHTNVRSYQRWVCTDCGKWSRSGKSVGSVDIREVAA